MKKIIVGLLSAGIVAAPLFAFAAEFMHKDEFTLRKGETIRGNYYVAGGSVLIEGDVDGDLIVAGGNVTLRGRVSKDLMVAGGNVTALGEVGEDVRAAGGNIIIGGPVRGELIIAGGEIRTASDARISGDVAVVGGVIVLDGEINGMVRVAGGDVTLAGKMLRDVDARAGDLTVAKTANVAGKLMYYSPREAAVESGSVVNGGIMYTKVDKSMGKHGRVGMFAVFGTWWLLKLLMVLVMAYMLYWAFPKKMQTFSGVVAKDWISYVGWGAVYIIVTPIVSTILFATVLGVPLGILGILAYTGSIILACPLAGIGFGSFLDTYVWRRGKTTPTWLTVGLGVILLSIVGLIPIVGWIVAGISFFAAFGYICRGLHRRVWVHERKEA